MNRGLAVLVLVLVAIALVATGCARQESVNDVSKEVAAVRAEVAVIEARLDGIERILSALDAKEPEAPDLSSIEERLDTLQTLLLSIPVTEVTEEVVTIYEGPTPVWQPGTTPEEAALIFEDCIAGRVASAVGPFGQALGLYFAEFMDLDLSEMTEDLGDFPDDLIPGLDESLPVWFIGILFGCWTGDLN